MPWTRGQNGQLTNTLASLGEYLVEGGIMPQGPAQLQEFDQLCARWDELFSEFDDELKFYRAIMERRARAQRPSVLKLEEHARRLRPFRGTARHE